MVAFKAASNSSVHLYNFSRHRFVAGKLGFHGIGLPAYINQSRKEPLTTALDFSRDMRKSSNEEKYRKVNLISLQEEQCLLL